MIANCIYKTRERDAIQNLDKIPFPDRSLVDYDKYFQYPNEAAVTYCITLQGTRGCPFNCTYCHKIWPKKHVFRSAENILDEIRMYYKMGIKRFALIDDIFNFNKANSSRFFKTIIKEKMDIHLFFPNGTRGDIMTKDYIDLMVEAGTVNIPMALETASPRLQKMIKKNLNLDKLHENVTYLITQYPHVISSLFFMVGFPTETEEEAWMTLDFIKSIKWLHFPELHALTIYPGTEMAHIAESNGISKEMIARNVIKAFHELPDTLPFKDKTFVPRLRTAFLRDYWMQRDRMLYVLPGQMKVMMEHELTLLYNSFLNMDFQSLEDIISFWDIDTDDLPVKSCVQKENIQVENVNAKILKCFDSSQEDTTGEEISVLNIILLDMTHFFSDQYEHAFTGFAEPPLGLMYLSAYLKNKFHEKINLKVAKSFVDFDSFAEMMGLIEIHSPQIIGIRAMSFFQTFLHEAIDHITSVHASPTIIIGGPHATSSYSELLKDKNIDIVVIGEGEQTFAEIVGKFLENSNQKPDVSILKRINGIALPVESDYK